MVHREHKRVSTQDLLEGRDDIFTSCRHNITHLAERVVGFSKRRGRNLSRLQRQALGRYQRNEIYNLSNHIEGVPDHQVINAYIQLFDDLFFFGTLYQPCRYILLDEYAHETGFGAYTHKCKSSKWKFWKSAKSTSEIFLYTHDIRERYDRLITYISILLHEMCHAFFQLWDCDYQDCDRHFEKRGMSGHGFAWLDVALAVEDATRDPNFLNLEISLGRIGGLVKELRESGRGIPTDQLHRWHFPYEGVARRLRDQEPTRAASSG